MVRSSFEAADFFMDEPIFLKNMRIFKKKTAKYMGKYALLNLMSSTLLRLNKVCFFENYFSKIDKNGGFVVKYTR